MLTVLPISAKTRPISAEITPKNGPRITPNNRQINAQISPKSRQNGPRITPNNHQISALYKQPHKADCRTHTHQTNLDSSANLFVGRHAFNESVIQVFNESGFPQFPQAPIANKQPYWDFLSPNYT